MELSSLSAGASLATLLLSKRLKTRSLADRPREAAMGPREAAREPREAAMGPREAAMAAALLRTRQGLGDYRHTAQPASLSSDRACCCLLHNLTDR